MDLYQLIFRVILGVAECSRGSDWGCLTGDPTHDFIYAFLLPHIVLFIFLFIFAQPIHKLHNGLGVLFGVGAYIFIIYEGWYGAILAPLLIWWFVLSIIMGLGYFFITKFMGAGEQRGNVGKWAGEKIKKGMKKEKVIQQLEMDINDYKQKLKNTNNDEQIKIYTQKLEELRETKKKIMRGNLDP